MRTGGAEGDPCEGQAGWRDRPELLQQFHQYRWGGKLMAICQHRKSIEQATGPRRVEQPEYVRLRGHQRAEAAQQVDATVDPDQRIDIRDLHAALQVSTAEVCKYPGITSQGLKRVTREC